MTGGRVHLGKIVLFGSGETSATGRAIHDRLMAELRIIAPAIGRSICLETVARRGWGS